LPVPVVIVFVGWLFIFSTTGVRVMIVGLGVLTLGVLCFWYGPVDCGSGRFAESWRHDA